MVIAEGNGLPIGLHVDSAQPHEMTLAEVTLQTVRVPRKRGRPRTRPKALIADKGYDSTNFRAKLRKRGIRPNIPTVERRQRKTPRRGRPIKPQPSCRERYKVERCFAWMDNCRRLVVRYERYVHLYKAFCIVAIILWCINAFLK